MIHKYVGNYRVYERDHLHEKYMHFNGREYVLEFRPRKGKRFKLFSFPK